MEETPPATAGGATDAFAFEFNLWIDEISDSVRGRYDVAHSYSIGDDWGRFSEVQNGPELVQTLRPGASGLTCAGRTVHIALDTDGTFGQVDWEPSACIAFRPFRFSPDSSRAWPAQFVAPPAPG